jgi:hypothetical protein
MAPESSSRRPLYGGEAIGNTSEALVKHFTSNVLGDRLPVVGRGRGCTVTSADEYVVRRAVGRRALSAADTATETWQRPQELQAWQPDR